MKFQGSGSAARQARKILRKRIANALATVGGDHPKAEDIHEAHKDVKKARATLKLLRRALPKSAYAKEDRTLQSAGRFLGAARDAEVLVGTLDHLMQRRKAARTVRGVGNFRHKLAQDAQKLRADISKGNGTFRRPTQLLRKARRRVDHWSVPRAGWKKLSKEVRQIYRDASHCLLEIRTEPTAERLHTLRKRTNDLYRQLQLLEPLHPTQMTPVVRKLSQLKDILGEDHDLAVLRKIVAKDANLKAERGRSLLLTLIERSRTELQLQAMVLASDFYHEKPRAFEKRLDDYWHRWHHA